MPRADRRSGPKVCEGNVEGRRLTREPFPGCAAGAPVAARQPDENTRGFYARAKDAAAVQVGNGVREGLRDAVAVLG